jgi:predicted Zn finger-like uncharacterized protein
MARVVCPNCQAGYNVPDELLGKTVRCKGCQQPFAAQAASAGAAVTATPPAAPRAGIQQRPAASPGDGLAASVPSRPAPAPAKGLPVALMLGAAAAAVFSCLLGTGVVGFLGYRWIRTSTDEFLVSQPDTGLFQVIPAPIDNAPPPVFVENPPIAQVKPAPGAKIEPLDYINRIHIMFTDSQRFGLICPRLPDQGTKPKMLTRDERGVTNNTIVRIDGNEYIFGHEVPGVRFVRDKGKLMKQVGIPGTDQDRGWQTIQEVEAARVKVTQSVEIIVGEQTRLYDTALVKYHVWNRDARPHTVGVRIMLDTFIGTTEGVPFYCPSLQERSSRIPAFA